MKWIEITAGSRIERYQILSQMLTDLKCDNNLQTITIAPDDFQKTLTQCMEKVDIVRIGKSLGQLVLQSKKAHSLNVDRVGAADILYRQKNQWWARSALQYGIHKTLSLYPENVDITYRALVAGAGASANTAIAVLVQIGFKKIYVLNQDEAKADALITKLKMHFFGVEFQALSQTELLKIVGHCSIVINTTPNIPENTILEDLCYFNFLIPSGLTVEMNIDSANSPIIAEATGMKIEVVNGCFVAAQTDSIWTQWVWNVNIDVDSYYKQLLAVYDKPDSNAHQIPDSPE